MDRRVELLKQLQGDMGQVKFAAMLGIQQSYLSMIYHGGREPGPKVLKGLLRAFPERRGEILAVFYREAIIDAPRGTHTRRVSDVQT